MRRTHTRRTSCSGPARTLPWPVVDGHACRPIRTGARVSLRATDLAATERTDVAARNAAEFNGGETVRAPAVTRGSRVVDRGPWCDQYLSPLSIVIVSRSNAAVASSVSSPAGAGAARVDLGRSLAMAVARWTGGGSCATAGGGGSSIASGSSMVVGAVSMADGGCGDGFSVTSGHDHQISRTAASLVSSRAPASTAIWWTQAAARIVQHHPPRDDVQGRHVHHR